ncbi:UAA transporter [Limtongia smithiae]|uniref:UAA transporter n=1 Tax=Limtongia smithiae TaxID=1125753 RepID=UPI0034CDB8B0
MTHSMSTTSVKTRHAHADSEMHQQRIIGVASSSGANVGTTSSHVVSTSSSSVFQLLFAVGGIYASFLTWAVLQERISMTPYGPDGIYFRNSLIINTCQSFCAAILGYFYTKHTSAGSKTSALSAIFPSTLTLRQYAMVAATNSLASPFGYASLKHLDYLTLLLGKSCKLLPVMALHIALYRTKYPTSKYVVVALVTLGVSLFTIYHPSSASKKHKSSSSPADGSSVLGLLLLSINLLFDGLTSSTQDYIFKSQKSMTGPKMMCGVNALSTVFTAVYLLIAPFSELSSSLAFFRAYPAVMYDILLFSMCGAVGQLFIFYTLSTFGSLTLVTITVTRKMISMLLSVVWFKHKLAAMQWLGVALVFGGVGGEALLKYFETKAKRKFI